jgi:hypothetical protein
MSLVWDSTVPAPERFTLLALADRADEDGKCWPSVPTLARKCRTGESTIRRHIKALTALGVLRVKHRMNDSSMYQIVLARLRQMADPEEQPTPPKMTPPPNLTGVARPARGLDLAPPRLTPLPI